MKKYWNPTLVLLTCLGYVHCIPDYILSGVAENILGLPKPIPEIIYEAKLEATALINLYGYPAENHTIRTPDGYNLIYHRIPYGKTKRTNGTGIPVFLVHGMNCESTMWFDNGAESPAFLLADEGYDVWIANMRGTSYSNHTTMTRDNPKFWDFGLEEISEYDIKPGIDYILKATEYSKLLYMGQSVGTFVSFYLLSIKPEYNDKIAGNIALGPVLSPKYVTVILLPILRFHRQLETISQLFNKRSWLAIDPNVSNQQYIFCPSGNPAICEFSMMLMGGYGPNIRNKTRVPIYGTHSSSGSSLRLLFYFAQLMEREEPRVYDYGTTENLRKYGSILPPIINASQVTAPTVLVYGANDVAATPLDVARLARKLPNIVKTYLVPEPMFLHSDFMWAKNGKELVYDKIISYLRQLWDQQLPID